MNRLNTLIKILLLSFTIICILTVSVSARAVKDNASTYGGWFSEDYRQYTEVFVEEENGITTITLITCDYAPYNCIYGGLVTTKDVLRVDKMLRNAVLRPVTLYQYLNYPPSGLIVGFIPIQVSWDGYGDIIYSTNSKMRMANATIIINGINIDNRDVGYIVIYE